MSKVSVIIPTHNRPDLLLQAVNSVVNQTHQNWEIVVVDDGSEPRVDAEALRKDLGSRVKVLRNDMSKMQPCARDQGVQVASGEFVTHLDDDDLLAPDALEKGLDVLTQDPSLELVYLNVRGFGYCADGFEKAQAQAVTRILQQLDASESNQGVVRFGPELFAALLSSVPMAFQRSIEYRSTWNKVSALRRRVYLMSLHGAGDDTIMRQLQPPLRESEWALYAAVCCKTALLLEPVCLQRCEQQGFFSVDSKKEAAMRSLVDIKTHLLKAAENMSEFSSWQDEIRQSLALVYSDQAYWYFQQGERPTAYRALAKAIQTKPTVDQIRYGLRMLLPRRTD